MGIADFFRPKYKHSDARVRREAILELTADDREILAQVAKDDDDAQLRKLAIERLHDAALLAEVARSEADKSVKDVAANRAAELWVASACDGKDAVAKPALQGLVALGHESALVAVVTRAALPELRDGAFAALHSDKAFAELAKSGAALERRLAAVAKLKDETQLRSVAMEAEREVGAAAVDALAALPGGAAEALEAIATKAKSKQTRQRARKVLQDRAEHAKPSSPVDDSARRRHAEAVQVLQQAEPWVVNADATLATARWSELQAAWRACGATEPALVARWEKIVKRLHDRDAAAHAAKAKGAAKAQPARAADGLDAQVEEGGEGDVAWDPADDRDAERAAHREHRRAEALERERKAKEAAERSAHLQAALRGIVVELEGLLESSDIKQMDRALSDAGKAFEKLGEVVASEREALKARFYEVRGTLMGRIRELRESMEWERLTNVPKQEALIAEATALATAELDETQLRNLGNALKDLQKRWKAVGQVPRSRADELWGKFKAASDQVYERVKQERDKEQVVMRERAAKKEELIAKAEALASSTDWAGTAETMRQLQSEWKATGYVAKPLGDELWNRFRAACDQFFAARKPVVEAQRAEQERGAAQREVLCAKMEQLVAAAPIDDSWGKTIGQFKDLQNAWREGGRLAGKRGAQLWERFETAGDALFAKRDQARDAEANAAREELAAFGAMLTDGLAQTEGVAAIALAARAKLQHLLDNELRPSEEQRDLYARLIRHAMEHDAAGLRGSEFDPEAMKRARNALLARAKEWLPKATPKLQGGESPAQIAAMLRDAMAQNALRTVGDHRAPAEAAEDFEATWLSIGPVVGAEAEAMAAEFAALMTQLRAQDAEAGSDGTAGGRSRLDDRKRSERVPRERGARGSQQSGNAFGDGRGASERGVAVSATNSEERAAVPRVTDLAETERVAVVPQVRAPEPTAAAESVDDGWDDEPAPTAGRTVAVGHPAPTMGEMAGDGAVLADDDAD